MGKGRASAAAREGDNASCKTEDCGHGQTEHVLDGKTCWGSDGNCPCRGFTLTEDAARRLAEGEPSNQETLPATGPVTAADISRTKSGELNQRELAAATASVGDGSGDTGDADGS